MFKSFISRFTFFFWFFFLVVTIPIYIFTNDQFKDIIKTSEQEKITITIKTLRPIISIHLFLDQKKQLNELLNNMFQHEDIKSVKLILNNGVEVYSRTRGTDKNSKNLSYYESDILDTINNSKIARIYLTYSNRHLIHFNNKVYLILISTFIFSLLIFSLVYYYIHNDLIALRNIAQSLKQYSESKKIKKIIESSRSREISTIANVANEMFVNIAEYVKQLKSFNIELEKRVKEEIDKQQSQEHLMIHQSRQAAMGEMLESIAHQWRQPLNIIGLATANLETEYELGLMTEKKFHEKMRVVSLNINYMSNTIDDFRDFLNPTKEMITFNAKKSIEDVLNILNAQFENYNIKCELKFKNEVYFYGVENEFKQVMLILLNNSKDAIKIQQDKEKDLEGKITINLDSQNIYGIIKICDNGCGIDEKIINSIFNPYFSTKLNANGTGIGLYIAKNIIETRMKGNIGARDMKYGCCFTISMPLSDIS